MSPRTGRPTEEPKNLSTRIRLSDEDVSMLNFCCEVTGKNKSEIIRLGIRKVYEDLKK
jgi:predicted DNA-binding protein